jgi:hypothetical protein
MLDIKIKSVPIVGDCIHPNDIIDILLAVFILILLAAVLAY